MADYKDYLVRYDISVDVSKAEAGLKTIGGIAEKFAPQMQELANAVQRVASSVNTLRANSSLKFAPVIDVDTFKYQLGKLTALTRQAAVEMQSMFRDVFSVNAAASEAMRKGMAKMASVPTKSLDDLKGRLAALNKEYDKLMGTPTRGKGRKKDGSIQMAKNALAAMRPGTAEYANMEQTIKDREAQAKSLKGLISQTKSAIKEYNKTEKAAGKVTASTPVSVTKTGTVAKPAAAAAAPPLSNVSAQAINAWSKFFGKSKSKTLTLNIKGKVVSIDANGKTFGLNIIGLVKELRSQVKEAMPINVKVSPAQVKEAIKSVTPPTLKVNVQLSANGIQEQLNAITGGLKGKSTGKGKKGAKGGKGAKGTAAGAASMMVDVIANVVGATPATELVVPVTGEIVKAIAKLATEAVVPVVGEVTKVVNQKGKTASLPVTIKTTNEQLKKLTTGSKVPPIELVLDTTAALAKLDEFIAKIKAASPQNIALTASATQSKADEKSTTSVAPILPAKGGSSKSTSPVLTAAEKRSKLKKGFDKIYSDEKKSDLQRARAEKARIRAQQKADDQQGFKEWSKSLDDKKKAQRAAAERQRKFAVQRSIAGHQMQIERMKAQFINSIGTMAKTDVQRNLIFKNRKFFQAALKTSGVRVHPGISLENKLKYLNEVSRHMGKAGVAVPIQMINEMQSLQRKIDFANSGSGYYGGLGRHKPMNFFDKTRKWAFPFTGPTSFGVRTPMAVDMAKGMGVMFAIGGAMSAIGSSFGQAMEYQNTMRTTKAILQNGTSTYSEKGFHNMEKIVRNVGVRTKFSAPEVANAARFLAMAGYDIPAINNAIRPIADLALIGDTDLGETADKMTNIMTTFGIPAKKMRQAANIMTTTATRSNTDLMMLAESAKYGGGVANMYGKDDPNLFADTMAIFGIMGNAGIQASSAGTALRMMYQNIFNPNKKQSAILASLEKYGIKTMEGKGKNKKYRAMSSILLDMANKIPKEEMAEIISKLFRITAQPGANAALMAAANDNARELVKAAEEDGTNAEEAAKGMDKLADFIQDKGVGKLLELMIANRQSANSNVSESIALEKQNTIHGLWAQVTSMFTEGIVKAFEKKQGYFSDMLANLRNYMAKPETVRMLQNLLDLVIGIAKVLGTVAGIWANIYSMAPGLIKFWITTQMLFSQFGTLLSPFVALTGVVQRFGSVLSSIAGMGGVGMGTGAAAAGAAGAVGGKAVAASNAAMMAPLIVGRTAKGKDVVIKGAIAARARKDIASANMRVAVAEALLLTGGIRKPITPGNPVLGGMPLPKIVGKDKSRYFESGVKYYEQQTKNRYSEVQARARKIYGPVGRFKGGFNAGRTFMNGVNFAAMGVSLSTMFSGLMGTLGKAIGFLASPVSLAIAGLGSLCFFIYKLKQRIDGLTPKQEETEQRVEEAGEIAGMAWNERGEKFAGLNGSNNKPIHVQSSRNRKAIQEYNERQEEARKLRSTLLAQIDKNASDKSNETAIANMRRDVNSNPILKMALGEDYDRLIGGELESKLNEDLQNVASHHYRDTNGGGNFVGALVAEKILAPTKNARIIQNNILEALLMQEGGTNADLLNTLSKVTSLKEALHNKKISQAEYSKQIKQLVAPYRKQLNAPHLSLDGVTPDMYSQLDSKQYAPYWQGAWNVLSAYVTDAVGTPGGILAGEEALLQGLKTYSKEWWLNIGRTFYNYQMFQDFYDANEKFVGEYAIKLAMLPNGKLDYSTILAAIQKKDANLRFNLQGFADMAAALYQILVQHGFAEDTSQGSYKFVRSQLIGQPLSASNVRDYYKTYIAGNADWQGVTEDQYVDFIFSNKRYGKSAQRKLLNGRTWSSKDEISTIVNTMARDAVNAQKNPQPLPSTPAPSTTETSAPESTVTPTLPTGAGNSGQIAYASPYGTNTPRQTQVIINVENLANFDRTTIASSAEERDLMEGLETKITDALHQLVAQAAYGSGYLIDVT